MFKSERNCYVFTWVETRTRSTTQKTVGGPPRPPEPMSLLYQGEDNIRDIRMWTIMVKMKQLTKNTIGVAGLPCPTEPCLSMRKLTIVLRI